MWGVRDVGEGEGRVTCVRLLYRHHVLSSMHFGAHISCTGNHTMWDLLSGLTTCLCLLFLLSALFTRVVCAHALLVFTSVPPSKVGGAACLAAGPCWTHWCHCSHSAQWRWGEP